MSLARLLNQPLQIVKVGSALDEYGNAVATPTGAAVDVLGYLEQKDSVEFVVDRDTVVTTFQVFLPAGTDVSPFDRITFGGQTFEVDGEPWQVYNPRVRSVSHLQAKLKVVR